MAEFKCLSVGVPNPVFLWPCCDAQVWPTNGKLSLLTVEKTSSIILFLEGPRVLLFFLVDFNIIFKRSCHKVSGQKEKKQKTISNDDGITRFSRVNKE